MKIDNLDIEKGIIMTVITHISDMHIGNYTFDEEIFLKSVDEINDLSPDMIILTGDITDNGYYKSFLKAKEYLKLFKAPLFAIPGNHDSRNRGYQSFEEVIGERKWCVQTKDGIIVVGLDSSSPDLDTGHIGRNQQEWMEEKLKRSKLNGCNFSILALHHHVIPIPRTGRERNVLNDAGDILESIVTNNVDLVISGHKHVANIWKLEDTLFINAATFSSNKLRGKDLNSYNTYFIDDNKVDIYLNEVGHGKTLFGKFNRLNKNR